MDDSDIEYNTLKMCAKKLELAIRVNLADIALFLFQQNVLSKTIYDAVTSCQSVHSPNEKAHEVFKTLLDEVELNKDVYRLFVDYLRSIPKMFNIATILDEEYAKLNTGAAANPLRLPPRPISGKEADVMVPDQFSKAFTPKEFADWMKFRYQLPKQDCNRIIENYISGQLFLYLDSNGIKESGFEGSAYNILIAAQDEIKPTDQPDSVHEPNTVAELPESGQKQPSPDIAAEDQAISSVETDFFGRKKSKSFGAVVRGAYKPKLKLDRNDKTTTIEPKLCSMVELAAGYYPMKSKTHGVALIINNRDFTDATRHKSREGTDRDEYNLIETWRYLGYQVEVRRDITKSEFTKIFYNIDLFLKKVCSKSHTKVENDSFVCCILSHGDKFCIYSSDSKEVTIQYMECGLGESETLNSKPKIFFIQACQGGGLGTKPVQSKLQADGESQTSRRADVYISYATVPGDMCYRDIEKGSWFIDVVCKTLCKESTCCSLNEMQHSINAGVADEPDYVFKSEDGNYKQQPSCSDQLRRNVHFFHS